MIDRPILVLSSWGSGSPLVSGFLGHCGGYLCPPFAKSSNPDLPITYESEMYRGLVSATVNEFSFEYRVEPSVFRNGFKSWFTQQMEAATKANKQKIVLNHPLSVFLLDEICQIVDPIFLVVTRPFNKIEVNRVKQQLEPSYGQDGARVIYERAYTYLHEHEKVFLAVSFRNFAASHVSRLQIVDYCDLSVTNIQAEEAFSSVFPQSR